MEKEMPIYSHNPYDATKFPLLVLDVERQMCRPANEGFRVFHWHEEIQFVYILRGIVRFKIYDKEIDLKAGDCMFINQSAPSSNYGEGRLSLSQLYCPYTDVIFFFGKYYGREGCYDGGEESGADAFCNAEGG